MMKFKKNLSRFRNYYGNGFSIEFLLKSLFLWKFYFIGMMMLMVGLGILAYILADEEYETNSELLLEDAGESNNLGQLSQLANVAGFNLPSQGAGGIQINPKVYEKILTSHVFLSEVLDFPFYSEQMEDSLTLRDYFHLMLFEDRVKEDISNQDMASNRFYEDDNTNIRHYSNYDRIIMNQLKRRITFTKDEETISIAVKMPEAHLSALVNYHVVEKLKEYLINYKTERLGRNLAFIESRKDEAEEIYLKAQRDLANFRDRNLGVISQLAKTREDNLQAEVTLAFNVYNALSQNLEQSKIQFQKETPVFFFIEVPIVLNQPTEPKLIRYIFVYFGLGIILCMFFYFLIFLLINIPQKETLTVS